MKRIGLLCVLLVVAGGIVLLLVARKGAQQVIQGAAPEQGSTELRFREVPAAFVHTSNFEDALPFMALSAIDVDNDGVDEIFAGGGIGQQDALLSYADSRLELSAHGAGITKDDSDPTYGAASTDATADGLPDLFVARASGLYFYENTGTGFDGRQIDFPLDRKSLPLSIALAEIYRRELTMYGVRVSSIQPGPIQSDLWGKNLGSLAEYAESDYGPMAAAAEQLMRAAARDALPAAVISDLIERILTVRKPRRSYVVNRRLLMTLLFTKMAPAGVADYLLGRRFNPPTAK